MTCNYEHIPFSAWEHSPVLPPFWLQDCVKRSISSQLSQIPIAQDALAFLLMQAYSWRVQKFSVRFNSSGIIPPLPDGKRMHFGNVQVGMRRNGGEGIGPGGEVEGCGTLRHKILWPFMAMRLLCS